MNKRTIHVPVKKKYRMRLSPAHKEHGTGAATAVGTARKSLTVSGNLKGLKHVEIC
jgi:hypothetical protein